MTEQLPENPNRSEISIRDLILQAQSYALEVKKHWKLVLLIVLPFAAWFFYSAISTVPQYRARLTFMVNEDNTKTSGYSNVLANLGFSAMGGSDYNLDKILELSKSNLIVQRVLFHWDTIAGEEDYLANHMIRTFGYDKRWEGKWLDGTSFQHDSIPAFSRKERYAMKVLYNDMRGTEGKVGYMRSHYSESSGIMNLEMTTPSEILSLRLAEVMFDELSSYYIETSIEKSKDTYDQLKEKSDSVRVVLQSKQFALASFEDSNRGLVSKKAAVDRQRIQGDVQMLSVLYAETVRNLEVSSFALKNNTPFIKAIDRPYSPLGKMAPVWYIEMIKGIMIGLILGIMFVLGRRVFRDLMKSESLSNSEQDYR